MLNRFFDSTTGNNSHTERLVSATGGFLAIFTIFLISNRFLGPEGLLLLVPSMGASAVLLFAVPHGALSQPWNLLGGHLVSALIGVTCFQQVPNEVLAASLAVGLAIGAMYYLRCIHPPGGATALAAVIGGESTHALGYTFVLTPVMLNATVMLMVAIAFNYAFKWRRYPVKPKVADSHKPPGTSSERYPAIDHADLVAALSQIDTFIDVSEQDLLLIYDLATGSTAKGNLPSHRIQLGNYYSNGEFGDNWSVRQIVDESGNPDPDKDMVVYKVVAGRGRRSSGVQSRDEFASWARHEVIRDDENWKRVDERQAVDDGLTKQ